MQILAERLLKQNLSSFLVEPCPRRFLSLLVVACIQAAGIVSTNPQERQANNTEQMAMFQASLIFGVNQPW